MVYLRQQQRKMSAYLFKFQLPISGKSSVPSMLKPLKSVLWNVTAYDKINLSDWNRFDDAGSITLGICLILIAMVVRYGAELEHRKQS